MGFNLIPIRRRTESSFGSGFQNFLLDSTVLGDGNVDKFGFFGAHDVFLWSIVVIGIEMERNIYVADWLLDNIESLFENKKIME